MKFNIQFFGGRGASSSAGGASSTSRSLLPALETDKVTKTRKDDAMYALMQATGNATGRPSTDRDRFSSDSDRDWYLAEAKKNGTVRIIKDKTTNDWITTTYGRVNGVLGYYGLNVRTGEMISSSEAERLYHRSRA